VRGGNGVFDVVADGTRIFCKAEHGRFPSAPEILSALRQRQ
jgi:hypothetical protein